jgi:hypothetical protein
MGLVVDLRIILATVALVAVGLSPAWLGIEDDLKRLISSQKTKDLFVQRMSSGDLASRLSNVGAQRSAN